MWPYYRLMSDLPLPPKRFYEHLVIDADNLPKTSTLHKVSHRVCKRNGVEFVASKGARTPVGPEWEQWVRENIVPEFVDTGINWREAVSDTSGVHTDITRDMALMFNITTGGPDGGVAFWQERGQPLYRARDTNALDFDQLQLLEKLQGPENVWFLIDARILHSTEGLTAPRVQFHIGLNYDQVPQNWLVDQ